MTTKSISRYATAAAAVTLLAACQGAQGVDKSGGDTVVLRLATIDEVNNNGQSYGPQAFVDNLASLSKGRLKVEVTGSYGDGAAEAESNLVKAIASGQLDGGWPSTRAFAEASIKGLEAVEAPMTLTSYAAEKALVVGPVAGKLLARLDGTGVMGLGLAVGPLRRPFANKSALLGPADWKGARFRVYNSPIESDAVRALGGVPVNVGFGWVDEARAGSLRGAEIDIAQYAKNGSSTEAGYVPTNVVLWPKVFVLSIGQKRFATLTDQQQAWIRTAAERAVRASVDATYDETTPAQELCGRGVRFFEASPGQIGDLRAALRPVLDRLAADPDSGQPLREIQTIAAQNPRSDAPAVSDACRHASVDEEGSIGAIPAQKSALPDGVYRVEITRDDVAAAGLDNSDGNSGTWTLTVRGGTYQVSCRPIEDAGTDCGHTVVDGPLDAGDLRGTGHTVYFVPSAERLSRLTGCDLPVSETVPGACHPGFPSRATWTAEGQRLTFIDRTRTVGRELVIEPWQKIA